MVDKDDRRPLGEDPTFIKVGTFIALPDGSLVVTMDGPGEEDPSED